MPNKEKETPTPPAAPGTKVRWCGKTENLIMTNGKVYEILSIEKEWYRIIDDSGEDYLYPPEMFEIIAQRERMA